jgi:hypothetical protein
MAVATRRAVVSGTQRSNPRYRSGRTSDWLKFKNSAAPAVTQPHSNLLGFPKPPLMSRFLLARVGKPAAVAAGEQPPAIWRRTASA